jgi:hypothetical protein
LHQRYLTLLLLIVCAGLFWLSPVSRGSAQSLQPAPAATLPSDTQLNTLLAARNWNGLQLAFSRPRDAVTYVRGLDWLKAKIFAGDGGLLLALIYARDLWLLGESAKRDELRGTAALMALYASELIWIDGAKCEDRSAPGHRLDQLITGRADTLRFLKTEPAELKQKIVDAAIALERRTAPFRRDDELICRGGLAEISAGLERGTRHELPPQPGYIGKTVGVEAPPGFVPKFLPAAVYKPAQDKARAEVRASLLRFIE